MTRDEHIAEAERLLDAAKDIAREKGNVEVMRNLLDFAALHASIARAIGSTRPSAGAEIPEILLDFQGV